MKVKAGQRFTRLRALHPFVNTKVVQKKSGKEVGVQKSTVWWCLCDPEYDGCGNKKLVSEELLKAKGTRSCGCLKKEAWKENGKKGRKSPEVTVKGKTMSRKEAMKLCVVSRSEYLRRMREGWTFEDAILTPRARADHKEYSGHFEVFGETMSLSAAVRRFGKVSRQTVYTRIEDDWRIEDALTLPRGAEKPSYK